jgi:hypothetical protein
MPHIIRLRGPWEYEVLSQTGGAPIAPAAGRVQMPCNWSATLGDDFRGRVRYRRFFNWTAQLEAAQQVTLALEGASHCAEVTLNGQPLGHIGTGPAWLPITSLLQPRNELVVDIEALDAESARGGPNGEVRLEID